MCGATTDKWFWVYTSLGRDLMTVDKCLWSFHKTRCCQFYKHCFLKICACTVRALNRHTTQHLLCPRAECNANSKVTYWTRILFHRKQNQQKFQKPSKPSSENSKENQIIKIYDTKGWIVPFTFLGNSDHFRWYLSFVRFTSGSYISGAFCTILHVVDLAQIYYIHQLLLF